MICLLSPDPFVQSKCGFLGYDSIPMSAGIQGELFEVINKHLGSVLTIVVCDHVTTWVWSELVSTSYIKLFVRIQK